MSTPNPFSNPSVPNQADFNTFVYNQGITTTVLPTNSLYLTWSFDYALNNTFTVPQIPGTIYSLAVYNYGLHNLMMTAQDQTGQTYFSDYRAANNLLSFVIGPVVSSTDQGTGETLANAEWAQHISISAASLLKTPWGQQYLSYSQQYGPNIIGFS